MKTTFTLKLLGFSEREIRTFSAILSLSEQHLSHSWRIVDITEPTADFFVLANLAQSDQVVLEKCLPFERCLFCTNEPHADQNNIALSSDHFTPRISSLTKILNQAVSHLLEQEAASHPIIEVTRNLPAANQPITLSNADAYFDPMLGVLKYLLQTNATEPLLITLKSAANCIVIYLHPTQRVYFCKSNLQQLGTVLCVDDELSSSISTTHFQTAVERSALSPKPLSDLIWYIAFNLSQGRLLKGHSNQDIVYLTGWPNLEIPGCLKYVRLAAFMQNNAVCLDRVASKTATSLAEVYNFYNACYLVGLIEKAEEPEIHEKNLTDSERLLLNSIAERLKGLH